MGRGARRYKPPGPITNLKLNKTYQAETLDKNSYYRSLVISKDYRSVNYNVWRFYELVHGGGPCISREEDDIYSPVKYSYLQAVIFLQARIRTFLAKCTRDYLYTFYLSQTDSAIEVMSNIQELHIKSKIEGLLIEQKESYRKEVLDEIAIYTVSIWRAKKNYEPEETLQRLN